MTKSKINTGAKEIMKHLKYSQKQSRKKEVKLTPLIYDIEIGNEIIKKIRCNIPLFRCSECKKIINKALQLTAQSAYKRGLKDGQRKR